MKKQNCPCPKQAVILAGGQGVRLRPFTLHKAKPMYPFHGKPFLYYLIRQLEGQGLYKILLLLGYKADSIIEYIHSRSDWKADISFSITDTKDETGTRLRCAKEKLEKEFLLLYCDNYCPIDIGEAFACYRKLKFDAQITVYANSDGYTKDNVRIRADKTVERYDPSRKSTGLAGVDIGYAFVKKKVLDQLPEDNVNFEHSIYPHLINKEKLGAYVTEHRYYSIGDHRRITATESFLRFTPAVFLDRDGVLNHKPPKSNYVTCPQGFQWLPGAIEAVKLLNDAGYLVFVVTNQAGIALGLMSHEDISRIHSKMQDDLARQCAHVDAIYYCPHHWDDGCGCRKPRPGLLYQAQKEYNLNLKHTYIIGDSLSDIEAGRAVGCKAFLVTEEASCLNIVKQHIIVEQ